MAKNDMKCPYCGADNEVCHDDGFGYEEDLRHETECGSCGKNFVFSTYISFSYEAFPADCLNGKPHRLKKTNTFPPEFARMACEDCDYEEPIQK